MDEARTRKLLLLLVVAAVTAASVGFYFSGAGSTIPRTFAPSPPTKIVYLSTVETPGNNIYTMNLDGTGQTRLTDFHVGNLSGTPAFSPDGRKIAFVLGHHINVMNVDGSGRTPLTSGPTAAINPAWSWDSSKIVFLSFDVSPGVRRSHDAGNTISIINADGSGQNVLTPGKAFRLYPTFKPDGSKIAFVSSSTAWWTIALVRPGTRDNIALSTISANGGRQERLHEFAAVDQPRFGPDGNQIVFATASSPYGGGRIALVNADGTGFRLLTRTSGLVYSAYGYAGSRELISRSDSSPVFSPDGRTIAFASTRDGKSQIYAMNRNGGQLRRLSDGRGPDTSPVFTPDGRRIVFTSLRDYREGGNRGAPVSNVGREIYIMNADGTGPKRLTRSWSRPAYTVGLDPKRPKQRAQSFAPDVR